MAVQKLQVFLASRFDEFQGLRVNLKDRVSRLTLPPVEAIDLNDNAADPNPPLSRCFEHIDRADLFVLLVGEEYGDELEDHDGKSYTHLEYERALSNQSIILVFLIGPSHSQQSKSRQVVNDPLGKWIKEIWKNHTPACHNMSPDSEELASAIYDQVLTRLIEIFADVDDRELDESGEETETYWADSLIKRDQLAKVLTDGSPLKTLAANHAKEALVALGLRLPRVAIHHLKKAVDLVPLDIVLGCWLARLFIATGRRPECIDARLIALRGARVATGRDGDLKIETMTCYLLAARASERLGEFEVAKEFAQTAHKGMPTHWLAKLEYGRHFAFDGHRPQALKMAEDAFWLNPDSIRLVQSDGAYRSLANDYDQFRARLRQEVKEEIELIAEIEGLIRQFSDIWGVSQSAPDEAQEVTEAPFVGRRTIRQLVRDGRLSAKSCLEMAQRCAVKLAAEVKSFTFCSDNGLTPAVKGKIQMAIGIAELQVATLDREYTALKEEEQQYSSQQTKVMHVSVGGGILLIAIALVAWYLGASTLAVMIAVLLGVGPLVTWQRLQALGASKSKLSYASEGIKSKLNRTKVELSELTATMKRFDSKDSELRKNIGIFCQLVDLFERRVFKRIPFSPAPPVDRKGSSRDLVRCSFEKAQSMGLECDAELLPEDLRFLAESSSPESDFWLARVVRSGTTETVSRSAAYFHTSA